MARLPVRNMAKVDIPYGQVMEGSRCTYITVLIQCNFTSPDWRTSEVADVL